MVTASLTLFQILIFELPFKLIVATAWVANLNVDLFIGGHKRDSLR